MTPANLSILNDFADAIGLSRPDPQVATPYVLLFDHKWVVNISQEDGRIVLFASPGQIGNTSESAQTQDEVVQWFRLSEVDDQNIVNIGRHPVSGIVILHASAAPASLDTVNFRNWVGDFIDQIEIWADMLAPIDQQEADLFINTEVTKENLTPSSRHSVWLKG